MYTHKTLAHFWTRASGLGLWARLPPHSPFALLCKHKHSCGLGQLVSAPGRRVLAKRLVVLSPLAALINLVHLSKMGSGNQAWRPLVLSVEIIKLPIKVFKVEIMKVSLHKVRKS